MKIAVIGASGFIGTRLVECLHLGGGHDVVPIVRQPSSLALSARFDLDLRIADALDVRSLTSGLAGCDAVIHAALGDPAQIAKMPVVLGRAAALAGVRRLVYLSSASVHGQNPATGTDEESPLHLRHALDYNNAKVAAERFFFAECRQHDLEGYALRPGVVFGPRSRWIANLAEELQDNRAWLFRGGQGICNSIYVDNLVAAARLCLDASLGSGHAYLVSDAETVTWRDLYHAAARELAVPPENIHDVEQLPAFNRSWSDRASRAVAHPVVQRTLPLVPFRLKRSAKTLLAAWSAAPAADSWTLPSAPQPRITEELAALQQCTWKFPSDRAARVLGYQPPVTFADGVARSFAWWRFAQGEFLPAAS